MRIIFMGTPEFAVPSLQELAKDHEIAAVVTQPDRRRGRGQRVSFSAIKKCALDLGLTVLQPERVSAPGVMDQLESYNADLFVIVAFGQKIPDRLLSMPRYGCINIHSSLLPKYRGAAPINAAIMQGEQITGVSTMYLSSEWDAGDIILQAEEEILPNDTAGSLHDRLMVKGATLLSETVKQIELGQAPRIPQNHSEATYAPKLSRDDGKLDLSNSAPTLANHVRGLNPWPGAFIQVGKESVKIWEAVPSPQGGSFGEILAINENGLLIACGEGSLLLNKLQRPNGKVVSGQDFANGLRLSLGDNLQS